MFSAAASSLDEWSSIAESSFVPLRVQRSPTAHEGFHGEIVGHGLDQRVGLARIAARPCRMTRSGRVTEDTPDTLFLSIQRTGSFRVAQEGRAARALPGEAVLYRSTGRLLLECEAATSCLTIQVPSACVGVGMPVVSALLARTIPSSTPALRVLAATAGTLDDTVEDLDPLTAGRMSSAVLEMLDALLGSLTGPEVAPAGAVAFAMTMQRFVLDNLADPGMSVDTIARRFGVSGRYVTRVFAEAGQPPPATFVRDERLRRAVRLLERGPRPTVAAVAARCGFADATTFARAFRRRYGVAPGTWARPGHVPAVPA
ncbi:AraC family transcriptional regulator [Pseudonocardia sp. N23]|uniref:AraC family transcriptional regulator n=1 Tax=Pseudonocardia sp. N23 TaxID=1987376 RepID=UPI000BFD2B5B|nr:AraC family transcriptional regulator [Pseudonocardia sp. N23]GAY07392.1 transcriptional regulator, AraC family [Pseudonocardia sp. N23]